MIEGLTKAHIDALEAIAARRFLRVRGGYRARGVARTLHLKTAELLQIHGLVRTVFYNAQNEIQLTHLGHKELAERGRK